MNFLCLEDPLAGTCLGSSLCLMLVLVGTGILGGTIRSLAGDRVSLEAGRFVGALRFSIVFGGASVGVVFFAFGVALFETEGALVVFLICGAAGFFFDIRSYNIPLAWRCWVRSWGVVYCSASICIERADSI